MLEASRRRLLEELPRDALVLDVGGWARPFERADWVIDLLPYATRGLYGYDRATAREHFSERTWVQRDMCDRAPWPFADGQFDVAICSHTLEDVRDPVWVCAELNRVARAGYIEVPSRLEEQCWGIQGPWVGWGHHHWLVDVGDDDVEFVLKHHVMHGRSSDHFPRELHRLLDERDRVQTLWWRGGFTFRERVFVGPEELDAYLAGFVSAHLPAGLRRPRRIRRRLGRLGRLGRRA